ncbi:MAG: hypothetical protein MJ141_02580 [Clostridia bacterium]|nr:hypothetical protein [Clostridia bacterium]
MVTKRSEDPVRSPKEPWQVPFHASATAAAATGRLKRMKKEREKNERKKSEKREMNKRMMSAGRAQKERIFSAQKTLSACQTKHNRLQ